MAYAWTEGGWWPQRHVPPGNLEVALENFGASARGQLGPEAAFDARFMLDQHFQWSSSQPSSFTQQSSSFTQQSPTDTWHGDSYGMPQDGYSPWQPLQHQADEATLRSKPSCEAWPCKRNWRLRGSLVQLAHLAASCDATPLGAVLLSWRMSRE